MVSIQINRDMYRQWCYMYFPHTPLHKAVYTVLRSSHCHILKQHVYIRTACVLIHCRFMILYRIGLQSLLSANCRNSRDCLKIHLESVHIKDESSKVASTSTALDLFVVDWNNPLYRKLEMEASRCFPVLMQPLNAPYPAVI